MSKHLFRATMKLLWLLPVFLASVDAHAVPAYARQTGENCIACHVNFPELTPFGRHFKLSGYTLGKRTTLPLSAMLQLGMTQTRNTTHGTTDGVNPSLDPTAPPCRYGRENHSATAQPVCRRQIDGQHRHLQPMDHRR